VYALPHGDLTRVFNDRNPFRSFAAGWCRYKPIWASPVDVAVLPTAKMALASAATMVPAATLR
jgi:hypothetical protein